jgi:hypothetical protein
MQVPFPSAAWFEALGRRMNAQVEKYRALGYADSRGVFAVRADDGLARDRYFGVVFEVYECLEVRELAADEVEGFDSDWTLDGKYGDWKEMIENIRAGGQADPDHTLNRLSLLGHPFRIHGRDPMRVDLFHRQQASFQEFIEESAAVETVFEN